MKPGFTHFISTTDEQKNHISVWDALVLGFTCLYGRTPLNFEQLRRGKLDHPASSPTTSENSTRGRHSPGKSQY